MDLSKILKGHEGEIFYSVIFGYITLKYILKETLVFKVVKPSGQECEIYYSATGKYKNSSYLVFQKCTLFPSKENQDWEKWIKEHPAVEQIKIGQYFKKNTDRYQITNINIDICQVCNIESGIKSEFKRDAIENEIRNGTIKFIKNIEDILEPFDKVLVQTVTDEWIIDFYSHYSNNNMYCMRIYVNKDKILPYYPNKYLFNNEKE